MPGLAWPERPEQDPEWTSEHVHGVGVKGFVLRARVESEEKANGSSGRRDRVSGRA